jgi:hypothetical protein
LLLSFTGGCKRLGPDSNAVIDQLPEMERQSANTPTHFNKEQYGLLRRNKEDYQECPQDAGKPARALGD